MLNTTDETADDFIVANVIKYLFTWAVVIPYANYTRRLSARTVLGPTATEMVLNFYEKDFNWYSI